MFDDRLNTFDHAGIFGFTSNKNTLILLTSE